MDKCEDQLISADRSLKHHKNKKEVLLEEEEKLSVLVEREKKQIKTLEDVLAEVEKLERVRTMKGNCIYLLIFICGRQRSQVNSKVKSHVRKSHLLS